MHSSLPVVPLFEESTHPQAKAQKAQAVRMLAKTLALWLEGTLRGSVLGWKLNLQQAKEEFAAVKARVLAVLFALILKAQIWMIAVG